MAGKTLEEAHTAQRNAQRNGHNGNSTAPQSLSVSANVATTSGTVPNSSVTINGQTYILASSTAIPASVNTAIALSDTVFPGNLSNYDTDASSFTPSVNFAIAASYPTPSSAPVLNLAPSPSPMSPHDKCKYKAYVAMNGPSHASVDWQTNTSGNVASGATVQPVTFTAKHAPLSRIRTIPFILDSGVNCHISPERGDFKSLNPILPLTVNGFGGSSIQAIGMGTIEVSVASGLCLSLMNVLFVPNSKIHLLSVLSLNHGGNYVTHFDRTSCWVTNHGGATIIRGTLSPNHHLYIVSLASASVTHIPLKPSALYATCTPDVETWHHHLRHCNVRSIVELARKGAAEGMAIDLASAPPKYTHCICHCHPL